MTETDELTKANKRSDLSCDCKLTKDGWVLCKEHKDEKTFNITKQPGEKESESKANALAEQDKNQKLALATAAKDADEGESKVAKFIFDTMQESITRFPGASGLKYTINKGLPFKVTDPLDVEFFSNNHRFSRYTLFSKKPKPQKDVDELLTIKLKKIKGLKPETIDEVVKLYLSEDKLKDHLFEYGRLENTIPKKQAEIVIKAFSKEEQ